MLVIPEVVVSGAQCGGSSEVATEHSRERPGLDS